jgi:hypothetical protein
MKRQRIGLACEKCRKLKAKVRCYFSLIFPSIANRILQQCDGQRPECGRCKGYGFACTWSEHQKSSTKSNGTIKHSSSSPRNSKSPLRIENDLAYTSIIQSYEALIQRFREKLNGTDQTALNLTLASIHQQLPNDAALQIGNQSPGQSSIRDSSGSSTYVGKASNTHFFKTIQNCIQEQGTADIFSDDQENQYYDQTDLPSRPTSFGLPLLLPPREEGSRYLEIYFSTIHVAYPFLSQSAVLDHFKRICEGDFDLPRDRPFLALLSKVPKAPNFPGTVCID